MTKQRASVLVLAIFYRQNRRQFRSSQVQKKANFKMHMVSSLFTSLCPGCLVVSLHNPTVLDLGSMMALVAFFSLLIIFVCALN